MTDRFDSVVASVAAENTAATAAKTPAPNPAAQKNSAPPVDNDADANNQASNEGDVELDENGEPKAADAEDNTPFPKKAINALSRRDKTIGKQRAIIENMAAQIEAMKAGSAQNQTQNNAKPNAAANADKGPQEDDFGNYGEYLEARARWAYKQEADAEKATANQKQLGEQELRHYQGRIAETEKKALEYIKTVPDYQEVYAAHSDLLDDMPEHIEKLFYDADDGAMAFYNLAKEGKLEALMQMPANRAALEIGRAQGKGLPAKKEVSDAPNPLAPNKGTGAGAKSLDRMSADELRSWRKS